MRTRSIHPPAIDAVSAIRNCLVYARSARNRSVEGVASQADFSHHDLYKYQRNGRLPLVLIPEFETACDAHFVTEWLALRAGKLVIDIPTGRQVKPRDIADLQLDLNEAVSAIIAWNDRQTDTATATLLLRRAMAGLAFYVHTLHKAHAPELELLP